MKAGTTLLFFFILSLNSLFSQRFSGGEIRVQQTGTYSVVATVDIFTSINDDLETIQLCWGDGFCEEIPLVYSESFPGSNLKYNQFEAMHIYGQEAFYTLSISECCWGGNIINIANPTTEDFLLSTLFFLSVDDVLFGENRMPFFYRGLLEGIQGQPIGYNSSFQDFEQDEVKVEICDIDEVLFYYKPTDIYPSFFNQIYLDSLTSSFTWASPQFQGIYVLALCVTEHRNDVLISEFTRKMVIAVDAPVPVSTNELYLADQILLSPNPVSDILTIKTPDYWKDPEFSLLDARGKQILISTHNNELDVNHLKAGIYFLQVKLKGHFFVKKVSVVK